MFLWRTLTIQPPPHVHHHPLSGAHRFFRIGRSWNWRHLGFPLMPSQTSRMLAPLLGIFTFSPNSRCHYCHILLYLKLHSKHLNLELTMDRNLLFLKLLLAWFSVGQFRLKQGGNPLGNISIINWAPKYRFYTPWQHKYYKLGTKI